MMGSWVWRNERSQDRSSDGTIKDRFGLRSAGLAVNRLVRASAGLLRLEPRFLMSQ
jgi:hypothetical protein